MKIGPSRSTVEAPGMEPYSPRAAHTGSKFLPGRQLHAARYYIEFRWKGPTMSGRLAAALISLDSRARLASQRCGA